MTKFEYDIVTFPPSPSGGQNAQADNEREVKILNALGFQGWEIIDILRHKTGDNGIAEVLLKRIKE